MRPVEKPYLASAERIKPLEQIKFFCRALVQTIFTLGINLFFASQRNLWHQAITGKKIVPITSDAANSVASVGQRVLSRETKDASPTSSSAGKSSELSVSQKNPSVPLFSISIVEASVSPDLCERICSDLTHQADPQAAIDFMRERTQPVEDYPQISLKETGLTECHCSQKTKRGNSTSTYSESLRVQLEKQLTQKVELLIKQGAIDTSKPLVLCSFGPGGLLEELILHANLSGLGLQVSWVLVDSFYFDEKGAVKTQCRPLGDFCAYAQEISKKQKAPPPDVYVVDNFKLFETQPDSMKFLRAGTTNPFVWLMVDPDNQQEIPLINKYIKERPSTDLKAILVSEKVDSLRGGGLYTNLA